MTDIREPQTQRAEQTATRSTRLEGRALNNEEGRNEIVFQITMTAARKMLAEGLITREQYEAFDKKMQQKYQPVFGALVSNINLI